MIVELRRYRLHPGARDTLTDLFARELVAPQEAVGLRVLAWYEDLDDPDAFVWLRGFADMEARDRGLRAFYEGPDWARHADAANATMVAFDDVLLLRPLQEAELPKAATVVTTFALDAPLGPEAERDVVVQLGDHVSVYATEHSPNTYPRLPVREGEEVLVVVGATQAVAPEALRGRTTGPAHVLRLARADET